MTAAIYARVSTSDQNCEMQLAELRGFCKRKDWETTEYIDTGFSGAKVSRPALDRLMRDVRAGKINAVVVYKLDRWGRSFRNVLESIEELRRHGVRWIATSQNLDTDENNPTSRLLMHILGAVAEFERELIRERVKAGMSAARSRGKVVGRPKKVFDRTRMLELRDRGFALRSIAKQLQVGTGTVQREFALVKAAV